MATDPLVHQDGEEKEAPSTASKIVATVISYLCIVFWSSLIALNLLYQRIRNGPSMCERKVHKRPTILDEGWNHKYIQLDDVRLHYVETGSEDSPLMVLVHGFPEFWYSWRFQLKHFQKNFRVVAIDQRGYNLSDRPSAVTDYDVNTLANDVRQVITKLGYKNAVVAGHDWGAVVCWRVALTYPEVVKKLIIMNVPHPGVFDHLLRTNRQQFLNSWYVFLFQTPCLPEMTIAAGDYAMLSKMFLSKKGGLLNKENFTEEDLEAWKYVFSQSGALTPPINFYRESFRHPSPRSMQEIVQPETLVIWGTADAFLVKEGAELSMQCCANGHLSFVEASHWVQQDKPEEVNQLIDDFVNN